MAAGPASFGPMPGKNLSKKSAEKNYELYRQTLIDSIIRNNDDTIQYYDEKNKIS